MEPAGRQGRTRSASKAGVLTEVGPNDEKDQLARCAGSRPCRVLLAEDDPERCRVLSWILRAEGYEVTPCECGLELLRHLEEYLEPDAQHRFEVIVSDIRMPGSKALAVLEAASGRDTFPPMILCTAFGHERVLDQARRLGLTPFEERPFRVEELVVAVRSAAPITVRFTR